MLKQRIITAVIAAPIAIFIFYQGSWYFSMAMCMLSLVGWHEFSQMSKAKNIEPFPVIGSMLLIFIWGLSQWASPQLLPLGIFFCFILFLSLTVFCAPRIVFQDSLYAIFGVIYIGIAFSHFIWLRSLGPEFGLKFFALAVLGTWACDTSAYFVGTRWGVHKLCPSVSPAKSIEGAVAGFFGCMLVVTIVGYYVFVPVLISIAVGSIVGILCQLGDLVESALKRHMGVKDSGRFFPGHGGVLDRVDSLMFSIPAVYYFVICFVVV